MGAIVNYHESKTTICFMSDLDNNDISRCSELSSISIHVTECASDFYRYGRSGSGGLHMIRLSKATIYQSNNLEDLKIEVSW